MSICTQRCWGCAYSSVNKFATMCNYIIVEEHPRGCPAGNACTKFKPRKSHSRRVNFTFSRKAVVREVV